MSLAKLKNVNTVITLIHKRIPKTQHVIGARKTVPLTIHKNLKTSRSTSFLENNTKTTTISSVTQIRKQKQKYKKTVFESMAYDDETQHDDNIKKIERNISRLKVRAAEAEELKMVRIDLSKMYTESQKEIKRIQREKESSLNKSAGILVKLMVLIFAYTYLLRIYICNF